jgi:hypothetical protein
MSVGMYSATAGSGDLPWAFKDPPAKGYSIDLVDIQPAPGTPLVVGASVEFSLTVSYKLDVADRGKVALVFEDEDNSTAAFKGQQVFQPTVGHSGTVVLSKTIVVPERIREVRLFVPILPDGMKRTQGELTFRYPVKKS